MKKLLAVLLVLLVIAALAVVAVGMHVKEKYGGGDPFPEVELAPALFSMDDVEEVANLPLPPGNIAVSESGRVFISFHPEGRPEYALAEIVDGQATPWPSKEAQSQFETVLGIRIDRQGRLWTLDNANHGKGQPRLTGFDLESGEVVHTLDFDKEVAPEGSHLNDFQVHPNGAFVFIADASIMGLTPALLIVDLRSNSVRRVLEGHESVMPEKFIPVVQGRKMEIFGVFAIRPGVDSIALNRRGTYLYFGAVTSQFMYRVSVRDLQNPTLTSEAIAQRVFKHLPKPESDGITIDNKEQLYISDPSHSAILRINRAHKLETLLMDDRIRWPDGFSFGPDGWLYFTCSSLHQVIGRTDGQIKRAGPYQVYRFKPGAEAPAGH